MNGLMAASNQSAETPNQIAAAKPSRMYMADTNEASAGRRHCALRTGGTLQNEAMLGWTALRTCDLRNSGEWNQGSYG